MQVGENNSPPAPHPRGLFAWIFRTVWIWLRPLPWWLRAPVTTSLFLVAVVLVRVVAQVGSAANVGGLAVTLGKLALVGLVAGGVPTLLFKPLRRLGYPGSLLNGLLGIFSYLFACLWAFDELPTDQRSMIILLAVGSFFGLLVGHVILHPLARVQLP